MRAVKLLLIYLEELGMTDANLGEVDFHNCGIF